VNFLTTNTIEHPLGITSIKMVNFLQRLLKRSTSPKYLKQESIWISDLDAPLPELPLEMVVEIFQYLQFDLPTLLNLRCVSKFWSLKLHRFILHFCNVDPLAEFRTNQTPIDPAKMRLLLFSLTPLTTTLDISGLIITNEVQGLAHLTYLQNLTRLVFTSQKDARCLKHIARVQSLKSIDLSMSKSLSEGQHLKKLAKLPNLEELTLLCCSSLNDAGMKSIAKITQLKKMTMSHCKFTEKGLASLSNLVHLKQLGINFTGNLPSEAWRCLSALTDLESLSLNCCGIDDNALQYISGLTNLTSLQVSTNRISSEGLASLSGLTNLKILSLDGNRLVCPPS